MLDTSPAALDLPLHPTRRHPLTGQPLRAVWVRPDGRVCWPILGGAPEGEGGEGGAGGGEGGAGGGTGGGGAGAGGEGGEGGSGTGGGTGNATDGQGRDLGFPKDTAVAEMDPAQQAAYWRNQSQKHEGRFKALTGDRSFDETKADLAAYAEVKKSQQTPAEQALAAAKEEGRKAALLDSSTKAATAILRANLKNKGLEPKDIDDVLDVVDVKKFIGDDGDVDTDRLAATAERFNPPGTGNNGGGSRRDFGGGNRGGSAGGGATTGRGKAEAARRFGTTTKTD